jgi:serine/threonine protein kinase
MPLLVSDRDERSQLLDALIAKYELAAELGNPFDPEACLLQHPEFAEELRDYFSVAGQLQGMFGSPQANSTATMELGPRIRDYQVLEQIGAGGMGTVYLARHTRLDKTVALKIMKGDRERDSQAIARFEREMWAVGKLEHPHIVRALDAGEEAGTHFLVMEFLEGCDLGRLLKAKGPMEVPLACELIRQAALGLQHAHDHNLVHRDVKPSNLLFSASGQVKVLDLGLAQLQTKVGEAPDFTRLGHTAFSGTAELTRDGQFVGTWRYMAPEQFMPGRQVDSRADIYSLGVTLYSFLVGELPLAPGQTASCLPPIASLRPDVPPDVRMLLDRMLAYLPEERIQTMSQVARELQTYSRQGSAYIRALGENWTLLNTETSSALDGTQPWSSTVVEIIQPPLPEPRSQKGSAGDKPVGALGLNQVALLVSACAVLAVVALVLLISNSVAKTWERDQAAARIAELAEIATRALERGDQASAEASLQELISLSREFVNLLDAQTLSGYQKTIQLLKSAAGRRREIQEAHAEQQWALLASRLKAYLQEPYATETDEAESLLADVEFLLANLPGNQAQVADWSDAKLAKFLGTPELPPEITNADPSVRDYFRNHLHELAISESNRRDMEWRINGESEAACEAFQRQFESNQQRVAEDKERARKILEEEAEARLEWSHHPESHGILALIPQNAIGAVGVVSSDQMIRSAQEIDREILDKSTFAPFLGWLFGIKVQKPKVGFLEAKLRPVLENPPLGCYRQDQPVAIVFANPEHVGVRLPAENLNALRAIWFRPQIESLGVVVGTPTDMRVVEMKLELPAGALEEGRIRTSRLMDEGKLVSVFSLVQDGRLYVGLNRPAVEAVAEPLRNGKSLALDEDLPPREAERLAKMDLLVHFGPGAWESEWKKIADEMRKRLIEVNDDPETVKLAEDLEEITRQAKAFLLGVKLDQGVQASLLTFLSNHDEVRLNRFQELLGPGSASLSLAGLPQEGAIGAFATRGNGLSGAAIAQSLLLLSQQPYLFPDVHFPADKRQRDLLSKAFEDVWNQVEGTRAGNYYAAQSTIIVLDTSDPNIFIDRLKKLVKAWDDVALEMAGGDPHKARYRFAIADEKLDDRPAYRLSLTVREGETVTTHKLWIIPNDRQMVLSYGDEENPTLRQVIKDMQPGEHGSALATHPAILLAEPKLPSTRKVEVFLWLSEIKKLVGDDRSVGEGTAEYSSASLTLGTNSLLLDAWIPLNEIIGNRDLIEFDKSLLPPD